MVIKSIRISIKYLRKFLAGFVSIVPLVKTNCNPYPFNKENRAISDDLFCVGEDINLVINKNKKNNERK